MRVFAALPLPRAATEAIEAGLSPARRLFPRVRWVSAQGLHVTLHFFGEVPDAGVAALRRVFEDPSLRRTTIPARLGDPGQFPSRGSPRVLWVGLEKGGEEMRLFWERFERAVSPLGWTPDARGFTPHVTVARAGSVSLDGGWLSGISIPSIDFLVEECVLFQSILRGAGSEYVPLKRIAFEKGNA